MSGFVIWTAVALGLAWMTTKKENGVPRGGFLLLAMTCEIMALVDAIRAFNASVGDVLNAVQMIIAAIILVACLFGFADHRLRPDRDNNRDEVAM